ncbi:MAG: tripartite tricarboxylate transporter TctB family protein [Rhodospirillaceae bacterium]|nr:tripartite tricarboxylate transporter TctB family protein [Rhodospirillaceae bacterium]MDE0255078.1 tripartite tricarboxylate transporter TctB family protein [Rhodospirillaceae bacterium]MDE0619027.1 tripartite tricarboxylate transporter TctB family protein [Rhodospirillaceae bacterium]
MGARAAEGLIWLAFAALAFFLTYEFDQPLRGYDLGATTWPRAIILMIGLGAVGLLVSGLLNPGAEADRSADLDSSFDAESKASPPAASTAEFWRQALEPKRLLSFGLPLVYVAAMHRFGFLFVSPVFLLAYMYLFGYRKWRVLIAVNLAIYALVLLVFVRLLYTHFPPGLGVFHSLTGRFVDLIQ